MTSEQTVLVTGATGRVGGQVVAQLAGAGDVRIRALSRDPAAASAALGPKAEVVGGDLAIPDTLSAALDGVDAVFLVFPSVAADRAARNLVPTLTARARRIVYLSAHGVPDEPDHRAEPDGGIIGSHAHLEGLIAASAAEYTFLRSSGFAANTLAWAWQIRRSDVLRWFLPDARRALVHEADLAAVALRALTEDGHHRMAYHLTGPEQLTQVEQLAAIGAALGRALRFEEIDSAEAAAELFPGLPVEMVASIITGQAAMVANPEPVTDTVARLTGRPALPFAQWARDHVGDFTEPAR
ncbi:SDR family oxidoreductase [Microbispora sp. H11081]|uniref:SDR family oxidoreductase n=1 Tax=Microbispora sp. H11081 TaxID=2729107 RepID=UPI0014757B01|nr:NAD(P)H-binding protein [Microbispora sp. H11081]